MCARATVSEVEIGEGIEKNEQNQKNRSSNSVL